jgi:DNA-binding MarR family transcriptional regulator
MNELYSMPGHLIRRLQQAAVAILVTRLAEHGYDLTPVQYAAMKILSKRPGIDQATLAGLIAYDRTTIGGVVERLVQKGLVDREVSQTDRRARVLTLSAHGRTQLSVIDPLVAEAQLDILSGLPREEHDMFMGMLKRCVEALNDRTRVPIRLGHEA